jgi:hypothetical protein
MQKGSRWKKESDNFQRLKARIADTRLRGRSRYGVAKARNLTTETYKGQGTINQMGY